MIRFFIFLGLVHVFFLIIRKMIVGNEKPWDNRRFFPIIGMYFCIHEIITYITIKRFFPKSYYIDENAYKNILKSRKGQLVDCTYEHFVNIYTVNPSRWYIEEKSMISYQDHSNRYYMNFSYSDYRKALKFALNQRINARNTEEDLARFQRNKAFLQSIQHDLDKEQKKLAEEQMTQMEQHNQITQRLIKENAKPFGSCTDGGDRDF